MRFLGRAESIGPMWSKRKPNPGWGQPPPAGRPRNPGKRTRREDHALLIVRDEFRTGYSLIGLLASIARLRFTGDRRISCTPQEHQPKGDISTLPETRHFYFALTLDGINIEARGNDVYN